jgi:hypothetical protein
MSFPFDPHPSTLWVLHRNGGTLTCRVQFSPYGVMLELLRNGRPHIRFTYPTADEALSRAEGERLTLIGQQWMQTSDSVYGQRPRAT